VKINNLNRIIMYPVELTKPMAEELTSNGFSELKTTEDVNNKLSDTSGKCLVVINSVCGCAAGAARPGALEALKKATTKPEHLFTVFAGVDFDAVNKVREMCLPYPPSSPAIALFDNGELLHFVERHHIEGRNANMIADHLIDVFNEYCN
jgi:putative YphP/YqiW family bacilliredoxin|tara:strand:- start:14816 stop:15265 length:450 start_codon:yes stop_codon:yes gene_type:complete